MRFRKSALIEIFGVLFLRRLLFGAFILIYLLFDSPLATAHPDLLKDTVKTRNEWERRPDEEQARSKGMLKATYFYGSPVHERMTAASITLSGVHGRPFDKDEDHAYIRGVFWNDDPTLLFWSDVFGVEFKSFGVEWYREFLAAEELVESGQPIGPKDGLLARSHFGDLQFLHAMAAKNGERSNDTLENILRWSEFAYGVATGRVPPETTLSEVTIPGFGRWFGVDNGTTVETLFLGPDHDNEYSVKKVAAGSLLHMIQDSYHGGHTGRTIPTDHRNSVDRLMFSRGSILQFHAYPDQDPDLHKLDDAWPVDLDPRPEQIHDERNPISRGAQLLRFIWQENGSPVGHGAPWPMVRYFLTKEVFRTSDSIVDAGPSDKYRRRPGATAKQAGAGRFALLVGINDYKSTNVSDLGGAVNDVFRMKQLLVGKFGFPEENVHILKDEEATHDGILRAFRERLIDKVESSDDVVLFHFSGHGSQALDSSDRPDEADGLDETLVAYDSRLAGVPDITDDKLYELFQELAKKTRNATYVFDSCHSGAGSKALGAVARWIPPAEPIPTETRASARGEDTTFNDGKVAMPYAFISGSAAEGLSYEYTDPNDESHGALTYFLVKELSASGATTTYQDVMDNVVANVNRVYRQQTPQLDGENQDNVVFTEFAAEERPHYIVEDYGDRILVRGGLVHGLTKGSTLRVYPPGEKAFAKEDAIAKIKLTDVGAYSSDAELLSGYVVLGTMRSLVSDHNFVDFQLSVHFLDEDGNNALQAVRRSVLERLAYIRPVGLDANPDLILRESAGMLEIVGNDGRPRANRSFEFSEIGQITQKLSGLARWHNLLRLENPAGSGLVDIKIRPLDGTRTNENPIHFDHGDHFRMELINNADQPLYFYVIDLTDRGDVDTFYESKEKVAPGSYIEPERFSALTYPDGESAIDILKVIATDQRVPIRALATRSLTQQGNAKSAIPLAKLFDHVMHGAAKPLLAEGTGETWGTAQTVFITRGQP